MKEVDLGAYRKLVETCGLGPDDKKKLLAIADELELLRAENIDLTEQCDLLEG